MNIQLPKQHGNVDAPNSEGYTDDELVHFWENACNTVSGGDWGTGANIIYNMNAGVASLMADDFNPPYDLYLHPEQYAETKAIIPDITVMASPEGIVTPPTYKGWIRDNILEGGRIIASKVVVCGTGLLIKCGTKDGDDPNQICNITGI